ncbi:hypothetical protein L1987_85734 [Smallanthus sonchifolius]|uniref:Uncharacterized protein n=1 Tax=Smallanthus sonchifolius TaxID=185202 RepID=A0ACB8XWQ0_9ASTR|nr:hypothetical protein L1987_85734 [Smallanthus sonchifolius]
MNLLIIEQNSRVWLDLCVEGYSRMGPEGRLQPQVLHEIVIINRERSLVFTFQPRRHRDDGSGTIIEVDYAQLKNVTGIGVQLENYVNNCNCAHGFCIWDSCECWWQWHTAEKDIHEVHVQITLLPETDQIDHTSPDEGVPEPARPTVHSFCNLLLLTIVTGVGDETLGFWNVLLSPKSQVWKLSSRDLCEIAHNPV